MDTWSCIGQNGHLTHEKEVNVCCLIFDRFHPSSIALCCFRNNDDKGELSLRSVIKFQFTWGEKRRHSSKCNSNVTDIYREIQKYRIKYRVQTVIR